MSRPQDLPVRRIGFGSRTRDCNLLLDPWARAEGNTTSDRVAQACGRVEETGVRLVAETEVASLKRLESSTIRLVQVTLKC
jgi:hypothetical protein